MADRRDDERRFRGEWHDPETDRRIGRWAERYRGSNERGYGGGERRGRDWERGDMRGVERSQDRSWERDERGPRDRDFGDFGRDERFHTEQGHYNLAGLHDLDDLSELRERYRERRERDYEPRYGHGPGVENMERPRLGYGTRTFRRDIVDHELGHGGMRGSTWRTGAPRPMGRGPKGYTRSDERIREDICERLMTCPYDASDVEITVRQGEVTLTGTVRSRADKWGIEDVADSVLGVQDVHNQIRLNRGEAQTSGTTLPGDTGHLHS